MLLKETLKQVQGDFVGRFELYGILFKRTPERLLEFLQPFCIKAKWRKDEFLNPNTPQFASVPVLICSAPLSERGKMGAANRDIYKSCILCVSFRICAKPDSRTENVQIPLSERGSPLFNFLVQVIWGVFYCSTNLVRVLSDCLCEEEFLPIIPDEFKTKLF